MSSRRSLLALLGLAPFVPKLLKAAPAPLNFPGTVGFPGPRRIWDLSNLTPEEGLMLLRCGEVPGVVKDLDWNTDPNARLDAGMRRVVNAEGEQVGRVMVLRSTDQGGWS